MYFLNQQIACFAFGKLEEAAARGLGVRRDRLPKSYENACVLAVHWYSGWTRFVVVLLK
jgi:hypothetical protein